MTTLTGHLTQTDKRNIRAILDAGLTAGRINGQDYHITQESELYTVTKRVKDRGLIPCAGSKPRISAYTSTFRL